MPAVREDLTRITRYESLGSLPNLFAFNDGTPVRVPEDWPRRRTEMYDAAITMQFGSMPPAPKQVTAEKLSGFGSGYLNTYRVSADGVVFNMFVFLPEGEAKCPAVVSGDLCFGYAFDKEYLKAYTGNGVALVMFNRTELAPDEITEPLRKGPLYEAYPDYNFGALGAWAWGYSRCVDALERLDIVDMDCIAFTGHSRGGKTAVIAGVLDERAVIVNPNESGCGGCGCYRLHAEIQCENGEISRNETLADMTERFPHWMHPDAGSYNEADLPFDEHYLKALIAPRTLFLSDAASDAWANPVGAWQTTMAAREAYEFLGCGENLLWYYRPGGHAHAIEDVLQLVNVIRHKKYGEPLNDKFFKTPFETPELMFDWKCPKP